MDLQKQTAIKDFVYYILTKLSFEHARYEYVCFFNESEFN